MGRLPYDDLIGRLRPDPVHVVLGVFALPNAVAVHPPGSVMRPARRDDRFP